MKQSSDGPELQLVERELERVAIEVSAAQKTALAAYCRELRRWNEKTNLTALSGGEMVKRLVAEPVWLARQIALSGSLLDVGSGNGSPAIPIRLVCALHSCHLVESRTKRAAFLRHVALTLHLENVTVHRARFEDIAASVARPDWITLQAVALTPGLVRAIHRAANPSTTILWITSSRRVVRGLSFIRSVTLPFTGSQALLFHLDLF